MDTRGELSGELGAAFAVSQPPLGARRACFRVTLVAVPLKTAAGLVHHLIAQHPGGASQPCQAVRKRRR